MIARTAQGALIHLIRRLVPLDGLLPGGRSLPPDAVVFVPTLDCNLKCPYCFQRDQNGVAWHPRQTELLTLAEWQAVIADLQAFGPHVIVLGGELFLYRRALDLLKAVKAANLPLTIITNGIMLPKVAPQLLALGLDRLIVSLDGPAPVHNAVRGHSRGYELATQGLRQIIRARSDASQPFVQVSCALTGQTQPHLASFVEEMGALGVDRILFNGLIFATADQAAGQRGRLSERFGVDHCEADTLVTDEHLAIDINILSRQCDRINRSRWAEKVVFSPPGMLEHAAAYYAAGAPHFQHQKCAAIYRELWILPNGDIGACVHINEVKMGNVRQEGVLAAWNSLTFRHFREELAQELLPACARCEKLTYRHPPPDQVITGESQKGRLNER